MKVEVEKSCRKADLFKQKWNGLVSCAQPLGPVHSGRRGGLQEGTGNESFYPLVFAFSSNL